MRGNVSLSRDLLIERLAIPRTHHRDVLLADLHDDWQWPLDLGVDWFVAFIAADARGTPDSLIRAFVREMLNHSCTYVCAWGPECERVEVLSDLAYLDVTDAEGEAAVPFLMTTGHTSESLAAALWFASTTAFPGDGPDHPSYQDRPTAFVALATPHYLAEVRALLLDPERLDRESDDDEASGRSDLIL